MKKAPLLAVLSALSWQLQCALLSENRGRAHFIIISLDGWSDASTLPEAAYTLRRLKKAGVHGTAHTVFPSMTWPAHTSMVTGMDPERHGVIGNRFRSRGQKRIIKAWELPAEKLIQKPTLPQYLSRAGFQSASILWPGLQGSKFVRFNLPAVYFPHEMDSSPQDFLRTLDRAGIPVSHLPRLADKEDMLLDYLVRDSAIFTIQKYKPQLMLIHFLSLDTMLHRLGPDDWARARSLEFLDRLIGEILDTAARHAMQPLTVFIVGDHGFQPVKKRVDMGKALAAASFRKVEYAENGQIVYFYTQALNRAEKDRFKKFLKGQNYFLKITEQNEGAVPDATLAGPTVPDFTAIGQKDVYFRYNTAGIVVPARVNLGMHGGPPESVPAAFIASGYGIKGVQEPQNMSLVDLTPAILSLAGIPVPGDMDGKIPRFIEN